MREAVALGAGSHLTLSVLRQFGISTMNASLMAAKRASDLKRVAYDLLLVLIGPVLLLVFPALPFANNGHCDPWYVYGLYFNLPELVKWHSNSRQIGRLTETLPGYSLTNILPEWAFDYVLFLVFFTLAVVFLYKTAALLLSRDRAALTAILFATSPIVIGNYAVTYSGPAITYEVLALYFAVRAIVSVELSRLFCWMLLSGVALGAALHAYLGVLAFSSFIYLHFALSIYLEPDRSFRSRIKRIAAGAAAALLGLLALTAVLSIFAALAWGLEYWSIVLNQIDHIADALHNNATAYWKSDWYRTGPNIGIYVLGGGAAAVGIVVQGWKLARAMSGFERRTLAIAISFGATLFMLIIQEIFHGIFLQYHYYAVFLWPYFALTLFSLPIDRNISGRAVFTFAFAIACLVGVAIKQYYLPDWLDDHQTAVSIVLAVVAVALLLALQRTVRAPLFSSYLLVLALFTLVVRPQGMGSHLWQESNSSERRHSYERVNSGLKFLAQTFAEPNLGIKSPTFWLDDDNVADAFSYAASYLQCQFQPFPKIDPELWKSLDFRPGDVLVIVARPPNLFERAKASLNGLKLTANRINSKTIVDENGSYELLVVRLSSEQPQ
jgi:hypothetical protein